jgi:hypothetical protein
MTDREALAAVMSAVLALAERLTGEKLTVLAQTSEGTIPITGCAALWHPSPQASSSNVARPLAGQPTPLPRANEFRATSQELSVSAPQ